MANPNPWKPTNPCVLATNSVRISKKLIKLQFNNYELTNIRETKENNVNHGSSQANIKSLAKLRFLLQDTHGIKFNYTTSTHTTIQFRNFMSLSSKLKCRKKIIIHIDRLNALTFSEGAFQAAKRIDRSGRSVSINARGTRPRYPRRGGVTGSKGFGGNGGIGRGVGIGIEVPGGRAAEEGGIACEIFMG